MSADQHAAARNLIAQLVSNSDVHGEDEAELARLQAAEEEDVQQHDSQQYDEQPDEGEQQQQQPYNDDGEDDLVDGGASDLRASLAQYGEVPDDVLSQWKEVFSLFDFQSTGQVRTDELGTMLRGLGHNLTEAEVARLVNAYDTSGSGSMDFPTFCRLLIDQSPMAGPCSESAVLQHMAVFDMHKTGMIPAADLVHLLRNLGEPLSRDDVDHLLQEIYIDGDQMVDIRQFVAHMFRTSAPNPE